MGSDKKQSKKKVQSKSTLSAEPEPVPEPVVEKVEQVEEEQTYENQFVDIQEKLMSIISSAKGVQADVKKLHKDFAKMQKERTKKRRKQNSDKKKEPSGFAKPTPISEELCAFLSKPLGTEMARTEVTKYLTSYIKTHDLQYPEDKRKIKPDAKLKKLLNLKKDDQVTYFNLQKYMKPHFESAAKSAPAH